VGGGFVTRNILCSAGRYWRYYGRYRNVSRYQKYRGTFVDTTHVGKTFAIFVIRYNLQSYPHF